MRELQGIDTSHTYQSIETATLGEYVVKGSKFLGFAFPVQSIEEVKHHLDAVRLLHPKAVHHCYAYKLSNSQFRANDDGEPSGTAGRPILGQLDSKDITNVLVIVVRYFGGVLLGTTGLISAYKKATQEALLQAKIIECEFAQSYQLRFSYAQMEHVMNYLKRHHIAIVSKQLDMECVIDIELPSRIEVPFLTEFSAVIQITKI